MSTVDGQFDKEQTDTPPVKVSPLLVALLIIPLLGIIAALVAALIEDSRNAQSTTLSGPVQDVVPSLLNWQAPGFTLDRLDDVPVSLADLHGQTVFLNFWQTTCAPCVRELPAFQAFIENQGPGSNVTLVAINIGENADQIREFLDSIDVSNIPVALDLDLAVSRAYGIQNLPSTFIIDAEGLVRFMKLGEIKLDEMHAYVEAVGELTHHHE